VKLYTSLSTCNLVCFSKPPWHFSIEGLMDQVRTGSIWAWTKKLLNFVFPLWYLQNLSTPFCASRQDSECTKANIFNPSLPENQRYRLVQCQAITYTTQTPDCSFQLKWKMTTRFLCNPKYTQESMNPSTHLRYLFKHILLSATTKPKMGFSWMHVQPLLKSIECSSLMDIVTSYTIKHVSNTSS
jgi:hypothetical protein